MDIDKKLDVLKQINQVEAPPFLLTRIHQRIKNLETAEAPVKWKWAFAASSIIIILLNLTIILRYANNNNDQRTPFKEQQRIENVVSSMNLNTTNNLYNE